MQEKYYSELNEIPLYNFEKCMEGDYRYISRELIEKWGINEVEAFSRIYNLYVHKYQKKDFNNLRDT